ncbi:unnamed protein product [Cyclocybe aegerita]|uniref:E3 ubiquitin protein ligase n=1 Tax=Cyclocybe aegerita TaxID=1973307 RepID=A0A8S0WNN8_CYCAE|nr:unnamed protein product [Cyclocybe aegerita]
MVVTHLVTSEFTLNSIKSFAAIPKATRMPNPEVPDVLPEFRNIHSLLGHSPSTTTIAVLFSDCRPMESRKRPLADEDDTVVSKKRIVTGTNGSPHVNDLLDEEDQAFGERLESYRKEAIYRRMKYYSREHERSLARIRELERRKTTCEAGLAAIAACWAQLVETIRLLVKTDDIPEASIRAKEIFDLTAHIQNESNTELSTALGDTVNATQALVTKFVQLGGDRHSSILQSEVFPQCQQAQNECFVLQSEISLLRAKLEESKSQNATYHDALIAAENRWERSQSASVREVEAKGSRKDRDAGKDGKEEVHGKPSSPLRTPAAASPHTQSNGFHDPSEVEVLNEQLRTRDAKIMDLEKEAALLRDQKTMIELEHKAPSLEQTAQENEHYKVLQVHASYLEHSLNDKNGQITRLTEELNDVQRLRIEWEEHATMSSNQTIQELKNMLAKRDADNTRLREQRDQQHAELVERRHKDQVKFASLQEYKSLCESNMERIDILQSELSRCKAQLAANAGDEDLMAFFLTGHFEDSKFYEELKSQKTRAENKAAALEQTLVIFQNGHPEHGDSIFVEVESREQLKEIKSRLHEYERVFGSSATHPPDVARLVEQLRIKEAELVKLRLQERQREENEASLFSELEKLSALWESLDRQLKSKVFDLSSLEERLTKGQHEKAKSENKYYAAMREKEAIDSERKNLQRTVEKQSKVVDRLTDVEKQLRNQVGVLEKECSALRKGLDLIKERNIILEKESPELRILLESERKHVYEMSSIWNERESELRSKGAELRAKEDDFIRSRTALEKQVAQLKKERKLEASSSNRSKSNYLNTEIENAARLVTCSTCNAGPRTTIITKCMHSKVLR